MNWNLVTSRNSEAGEGWLRSLQMSTGSGEELVPGPPSWSVSERTGKLQLSSGTP